MEPSKEFRRPTEAAPSAEAVAFVRFCYRRRHAGWPELYDEMCAVASRRLYNGWGFTELTEHGIGFSLFETPALAAMAREIVREETDRRRVIVLTVEAAEPVVDPPADAVVAIAPDEAFAMSAADDVDLPDPGPSPVLRFAGASVG